MLGELFYSLTTRPTRAGWILFWLHVFLGGVFLFAQSQSGVTLLTDFPRLVDSEVAFVTAVLMLLCTLALFSLLVFTLIRNQPGAFMIFIALFLAIHVYGIVMAMEVSRKAVMPFMESILDMSSEPTKPPKAPRAP